MIRTDRRRRGAILFEVMVGLLLLVIAGVGWITLMDQTVHTVHQIRLREHDYEAAADDLEHVALWTSEEFSAHTGPTRIGSYVLDVQALSANLFAVVVRDTTGATLLSTSMYAVNAHDSSAQ